MTALRVYLPGDHHRDWFSMFSRKFVEDVLVPRYEVTLANPVGAHHASNCPLYHIGGQRVEMHPYCVAIERLDTGALSVLTMIDNPLELFTLFGFDPNAVSRVLSGQYLPHRLTQDIASHASLAAAWGSLAQSPIRPWLYRPNSAELPSPMPTARRRSGLYFRGAYWQARDVLPLIRQHASWRDNLDMDWWPVGQKREIPQAEYFRRLAERRLALSVAGVGDICHRDIECFALGVPVLRPTIQAQFAVPLEPDVHYIEVPYERIGAPHRYPDHPKDPDKLARDILSRYRRVRRDKALLDRIADNALAYYNANIAFPGIGTHTLSLLDLGPAFDPPRERIAASADSPVPTQVIDTPLPQPVEERASELAVLLRVLRAAKQSEFSEDARQALRTKFDWEHLISLTEFHGVLGHFADVVDRSGSDISPLRRAQLQNLRVANAAAELTKFVRWQRLCSALADAGIRAITLKGFQVAFEVYGGLGRRHVGDLDILVRPSDVAQTISLLRSLGYEVGGEWERAIRHVGLNRVLEQSIEMSIASADQLVVDLHWVAGPRELSLPTEELLASALPISGTNGRALGATLGDTLAMLVTHGHKSGWSRLRWQVDLIEGLARMSAADAVVMRRHLERVGALPALATAFALVESTWGALPASSRLLDPLPPADERFVQEVEARSSRGWDAVRLYDWRRPVRLVRERLAMFGLTPKTLVAAAKPTHRDWAVVPLPESLNFLYYAVRPLRVLAEAARGRRSHQ